MHKLMKAAFYSLLLCCLAMLLPSMAYAQEENDLITISKKTRYLYSF